MGLFDQLFAGAPSPTDDYWYQPLGTMTASGIRLDAEGAQKISAFYRGVDLLSTALAMLPLQVFQRLPDDKGADVARQHPIYDLLHRKPNGWQDSFTWRRQEQRHLLLFGNAYNRIVAGRRGFAHEFYPIHPSLVTPEQVQTGAIIYHIRDPKSGTTSRASQDEIFHLRGASDDGVCGKGVLDYARDSIGTALATETYAAKIYANGALHGGLISVPGILNEEASKRMAATFVSGLKDAHRPKVLEQGATWTANTMTPENAQMLLSRKFSIDDIARWLGVPPHMIGSLDRSTNNNIEQQGQEFVTYSLGPWLSLWEFAINDQLILKPDTYYAEFTRDALVRGDIAARWQAYQIAVTTGTVTRNEVRRKENLNALDGLDEPLDPAFLTGKPPANAQSKKSTPPPADDTNARAFTIVQAEAARILKTEVAFVQKTAVKHAADGDAFVAAVTEFYQNHTGYVAKVLVLSPAQAEAYCWSQAQQIVNGAGWLASVEQWQTDDYAAGLAALALETAA